MATIQNLPVLPKKLSGVSELFDKFEAFGTETSMLQSDFVAPYSNFASDAWSDDSNSRTGGEDLSLK